jgi:hypothetical protein
VHPVHGEGSGMPTRENTAAMERHPEIIGQRGAQITSAPHAGYLTKRNHACKEKRFSGNSAESVRPPPRHRSIVTQPPGCPTDCVR